jgi:hypothetical protein
VTTEPTAAARYPEHEKQAAVLDQARVIGEFLEWLSAPGGGKRVIAAWRPSFCTGCERPWEPDIDGSCLGCGRDPIYKSEDVLLPAHESFVTLLARYFDIDLAKIETEKRAMLEHLRALPVVRPPATWS